MAQGACNLKWTYKKSVTRGSKKKRKTKKVTRTAKASETLLISDNS